MSDFPGGEQTASDGRFVAPLRRAERERFFFLDDVVLAVVAPAR